MVDTLTSRERAMLRRIEEIDRASRAKTQFLAAASHDLRQPLQAAALYVEVLRRQDLTPGQREITDLLRVSMESLSGMLGGLLDLSRLDAGIIRPDITDLDPAGILSRLVLEYRSQADSLGIRFTAVSRPVTVATDPLLLECALRNLLSNAMKHGVPSDRGRVLFSCRRRGTVAEFQVWDNGPGIPEGDVVRIFEEFRQLGNPERNAAHGFGLGLSIVARIACLIGAGVTVRSRVGRGSVFGLRVPLVAAWPPAAPAPRPGTGVVAHPCPSDLDRDG